MVTQSVIQTIKRAFQASSTRFVDSLFGSVTLSSHDCLVSDLSRAQHTASAFPCERDLCGAMRFGELQVHFQPKVSLATGEVVGAEALLRWHHPTRGPVGPDVFIPLAERSGLIRSLGEWTLDRVCSQLHEWQDEGLIVPPVALNLSACQLEGCSLVDRVHWHLSNYHLEPSRLMCEITETAFRDVGLATATIKGLRDLGLKISLDDFGTGYSTLTCLKRWPVDELKLDRSFVRDMTIDAGDAAICKSVIDLAHSLHMVVVAEGVETVGQMIRLREDHCDEMQGYLFCAALPAHAYRELLATKRHLEVH